MTDPEKKRPHLSPSQMDMYFRCGEQYRRRYIERHIIPPGIALLKGTAVHLGAEENFKQKVESRVDLPSSDIVDRAVSAFEDRKNADGLLLSDEEQSRGEGIVVGEAKDSVVRLTSAMMSQAAPTIMPAHVELEQRIAMPGTTHDLLGRIDIVDTSKHIRDFKTGKLKAQAVWDASMQLTFYSLTYRAINGSDPAGITIDQLTDGRAGAKYVPVTTTRGAVDYRALVARINSAINGINAGVFSPATPGGWWCSSKFCGYWNTCKFVNSERKTAAEGGE